ncbi:hypothetical protein OJF2_50990 [Aquisphaera giovannonii]|uniref:Anti-CBASS protein Acb1 n=1 Tax=Aquisphaera giovannonii TaxID=406548 RepID=A0A5B9W8V1_9BACT|nr:hypothetical protein [Aquisphaera giovannonii]QEH36515.1 hypothetical protein OJF2_50990 [Aquisphaera giovannonii]
MSQAGAPGTAGDGLYVRRNLTPESAASLIAWAKEQGFTNLVPEYELHATVVHSRSPVWLRPKSGNVAASTGGRWVGALGDNGAVVLHIVAPDLETRWQEARDIGASWDYEGYNPHVTFTYDAGDVDLSKVEPFAGDLVFGPEIHEPLNEHWAEEKGFVKVDASALSVLPTLEAMAIDIPSTPGHPNKHPFKGILTRIDQPSDKPPGGSRNHRVILTRAAAEKALPTLLGMPIDLSANLSDHDVKRKIGTITAATIEGDAIHIEGFLYAADFPDEVARVQSERSRLGFSYEMRNIYVKDITAASWEITDCVFTGAAILYRDKAAYSTTSLAAQAEENTMDINEFKELLKAQGEAQEKAMKDALDAGVATVNKRIDAIEASAAEEKKKADEEKAAAAAAAKANADKVALELQAAAAKEASDKTIKELQDQLASQATQIKDLQAAAAKHAEEPARKTLSPHITQLLARSGLTLPTGEGKLSVADVDKALAATSLEPVKRMEIKNTLSKAGLIA